MTLIVASTFAVLPFCGTAHSLCFYQYNLFQGIAVLYLALMVFLTGMQVKAYKRLMFLSNGTTVANKHGKTSIKDIQELEEQTNFV